MTDRTQLPPIQPRDFDQTEISDINKYININVPFSVLQQIYPLTENILNKAKAYTIMFRIIYGTMHYVEKKDTKDKLQRLLDENQEIYKELYNLIVNQENSTMNFGQRFNQIKMKAVFTDFEKNFKINKLIDTFLIFSERVTLLRTDSFVGIDLETKEGEEMYNKIVASVDKAPVQDETTQAEDDFDENQQVQDAPPIEDDESGFIKAEDQTRISNEPDKPTIQSKLTSEIEALTNGQMPQASTVIVPELSEEELASQLENAEIESEPDTQSELEEKE